MLTAVCAGCLFPHMQEIFPDAEKVAGILRKRLSARGIECAAIVEESLGSTNSEGVRILKAGRRAPFAVIALNQTSGRGRLARKWFSKMGASVALSVCVEIGRTAEEMESFTVRAGLGVCFELKKLCGAELFLKWPNDIYWKDKKICGILIENELEGAYLLRCIAGIGVNINQEHFISPAPNPVSLKQILGRETDKQEVLESILKRLFSYYIPLISQKPNIKETIHSDYLNAQYRHKGMYPYRDENGEFKASLETIEPDGHLLLRDENGMLRKYAFKEVQYII